MTENQESIERDLRLIQQASDAPAGRLALVALPWSQKDRPSAAVAALAAYVRRERPAWVLECHHSFVHFAARIGFELYDALADHAYEGGELLNLSLLYPEKADDARRQFGTWADETLPTELLRSLEADNWEEVFDFARASLDKYLDELADTVSTEKDVVGLTTCFGQLFVNLAFAQRLKRRSPQIRIILGGSTVSARVGPSLLAEYRFIDYVVQGEGEGTLVALLDLLANHPDAVLKIDGVLTRSSEGAPCAEAAVSETRNLDDLPVPDYDEYAVLADEYGIGWALPIEGSRGCWWDRTKRAGNPKSTCYFCNLNVQWGGYRQKSVPRLVAEIDELSQRNRNLRLFFLDNVL